jgi:hypothetical protein
MQRTIAAALALTTTIGACGGQQPTSAPPAATSHASVSFSDQSSVHSVGGEPFAFVGPVLRGIDTVGRRERASVISLHCLRIAQGIPYLRSAEPIRLNPHEIEDFFVGSWTPSEATDRDRCADALGGGWRLPTIRQARAVLTPRDAPWTWLSILVRHETGRIDVLRRETDRCMPLDPHCEPYVRLTQGTAAQADLYCVGPASKVPRADPSDAEIAHCVRAVSRTVRQTEEQVPREVVDEGLLSFIFAVRHACASGAKSEFDVIVKRVREEVGPATVAEKLQQSDEALGRLHSHAARVSEALYAVQGGSPLADCVRFPDVYRGKCNGAAGHGDCLGWQAQYAAHCLNHDAVGTLTALANSLASSLAELQGRTSAAGSPHHTIPPAVPNTAQRAAVSRLSVAALPATYNVKCDARTDCGRRTPPRGERANALIASIHAARPARSKPPP